jgi:hypothetical protein
MLSETLRNLGRVLRGEAQAREIRNYGKALNGNIVLRFTPTGKSRSAATGAWTESVDIEMVDDEGNVHTWLNGSFTTRLSIADTSVAGTASIASTTITFVNGRAKVTITGSNHAWLAAETATLTVANITLAAPLSDKVVTGGTFVVTITA